MHNKFLSIFMFLSIGLYAQEGKKDVESITSTIENYFYGYIERDSTKLHQAFDMDNGAMKVIDTGEDGKEIAANEPFKNLIPRWFSREKLSEEDLKACQLAIENIDVVQGAMASSKIHMTVGETTYIDILSLQKINQAWKITNKIFVVSEN